ncbi:MAG: DUF4160 domain-containing protein [Armatimonadetes bacterium]|nr:DUF4160 domain-containing protein [Armatimonadota bacterium]
MPTVLRVRGHRLFFFSNGGHEPPHIHIEGGGRYAKFWLEPVALCRSTGYSPQELGTLRRLVEENRDFLERAWHEHFGS